MGGMGLIFTLVLVRCLLGNWKYNQPPAAHPPPPPPACPLPYMCVRGITVVVKRLLKI